MSITGSEQWMYSSGREFYDFPIEQSLRFEDGDSAYLSRTPATAGNRKTFTYSTWVKRGNLGLKTFISAGTGDTARTLLFFDGSDKIVFGNNTGSGYFGTQTNAVFRDVSAWYNIVFSIDTTQATTADRVKIYVNGVQQTDTSAWNSGYIAQNSDTYINNTSPQVIGSNPLYGVRDFYDGYKADITLIDGQALDATSFGEFKSGIWIPKDTSGLTFGTNGFRLQFGDTTEASGFNTVTWTGNNTNGGNAVGGVGFSPDMVWAKSRSDAYSPLIYDSIRGTGATAELKTDGTEAEGGSSSSERGYLNSFDADGFSSVVGSNGDNLYFNQSGRNYVAWTWDAGSGSPASNTDGDITSTVKVNTDYGFSITSYTGSGTNGDTVGHGLGVAPNMYIVKSRDNARDWRVYHSSLGATKAIQLNKTDAANTSSAFWNNTEPTSSVFTIGSVTTVNGSGEDYIAYCFAEKTGYSSISSYTGDGTTDGSKTITTGFKPAFVMMKNASTGSTNWLMFDNTRETKPTIELELNANNSNAEGNNGRDVTFTDTGFTVAGNNNINGNGDTYIFMAFADTRNAAFWKDTSGQGNDWQPNNLVFSDVVPDSSTNNFATMNPLAKGSGTVTFSEGNLKSSFTFTLTTTEHGSTYTLPQSGKWYWEQRFTGALTDGSQALLCGIMDVDTLTVGNSGNKLTSSGDYVTFYTDNNTIYINNSLTAYTSEITDQTSAIVGFAVDMDNGHLWVHVNGTYINGTPNFSTGGNKVASPNTDSTYMPFFNGNGGGSGTWIANFGQDSTFANNTTAGGNVDANGYGDFKYAVPFGFLSLCSANMPSGAIDTLNDETPEDYFNTVLYSATAGVAGSVTGYGFAPDWIWTKARNTTQSHQIFDNVRGDNNILYSNLTNAESAQAAGYFTLEADGFDYGTSTFSSNTYVGWGWKAGGTGVSNTDGSITSTVSVAETSQGDKWFSVVKWTGNGTAGATVGHGLSSQPRLIITKNMDAGGTEWSTLAQDANGGSGHLGYLRLNSTAAWSSTSILWNNTEPTSSVFTLGSYNYVNASGQDIIGYCFANAEGLCRAGSYVGNGSADGTFVWTGFRPSFLLIKRTNSTGSWIIQDSTRNPYNDLDLYLLAESSNAEATLANVADYCSNGFKLRLNATSTNASGSSYIYLALAEQPFKFANAR